MLLSPAHPHCILEPSMDHVGIMYMTHFVKTTIFLSFSHQMKIGVCIVKNTGTSVVEWGNVVVIKNWS